jgi:glycosyltransferase involved in cell wall biosynthesis
MGLRIAQVLSSTHTGGAERVSLLLTSRLVRRGHDVTLVSLEEPRHGPLAAELRAAGARVLLVPKALGKFDPTLGARLFAVFLRERFDVVHTHNPIPLIYAASAARLSGARAIHTKHGPHPDTWQRLALRRIGAAMTHVFVAVSSATADFALSIREVRASKLRVVTNGTDTDRFRADPELRAALRERLGIPAGAFVIGTVGRMATVKNHPLLVRASAPLLGPDVRLVIVGDGAEAAATRRVAQGLGVTKWIAFPGEIMDVPPYLAAFDVFALSSDSEGLPLCLTEALSASLPLVCTAVGGVPTLVEEGETGLLTAPGDERAFTAALRRLHGDAAERARMARRAREVALARYSADRMTDDYVRLYGA